MSAIGQFKPLVNILIFIKQSFKLSHIKKTNKLTKIFFASEKCRLKLENLTRWSSAYLVLETIK